MPNNQNPLIFIRKLIPKSETLFRWLDGGISTTELSFDDRLADLDPDADEITLQAAMESIDKNVDLLVERSRTKLSSNLILTVSASGETADFNTIGGALDYLEKKLDLNGYQVDIAIEAGDYRNEGVLHLPTLVSPKAETCRRAEPEPTRGGEPSELPEFMPVNSQVRIYGDPENPAAVTVRGFELDQHNFYAIQRLTIQLDPEAETPTAVLAQRQGIIALESTIIDGVPPIGSGRGRPPVPPEGSAALTCDYGTIYLKNQLTFKRSFATIFKSVNHGLIQQIDNLKVIFDADTVTLRLADVSDSILNLKEANIDDRTQTNFFDVT